MRKFTLTSPAFSGEAEIIYDDNGRLVRIDVLKTDMAVDIVDKFKSKIAAHIDNLPACLQGTKVVLVESEYEVGFDMFWSSYKKKINKDRCEAIWKTMSKSDQVKAYHGINDYDKFLKELEWRKKADPETYLKKKFFLNDWRDAV